MHARSFIALPVLLSALFASLSLLGCAAVVDEESGPDDDEGAPSVQPSPSAPERPATGAAEPGTPAATPTAEGGSQSGVEPDSETMCPAGSTFDGVGCGRWSPVTTSCRTLEEPIPDGFATSTTCMIMPTYGATFIASRWADPASVLVDLPDGAQLVVREAPGATTDSTDNAETWLRPADGEWSRIGDAASIERPRGAVRLSDGRVLAIGCADRHVCSQSVAEIFDPASGGWIDLIAAPEGMWAGSDSLFALPDGDALVIGGGRAARIRVDQGTWEIGPTRSIAMDAPAVELTSDGRVLVVGGSFYAWERTAYLIDVDTLAWRRTADPGMYTFQSRAARAAGGVVVFGSETNGDALAKVYTSSPP